MHDAFDDPMGVVPSSIDNQLEILMEHQKSVDTMITQ